MANPFESLLARYGPLLALLLLAQLFLVSGTGKLFNYTKMATYLFNKGLPAPEALLLLVIVLEVGGALLLVAGFKARWVAAALFAFTLLASVEVIGKSVPRLLSGWFVDLSGYQPVFAAAVALSALFLLVVVKVPRFHGETVDESGTASA